MGIYDKYETDEKAENEGIKVYLDEALFYVARANSNNKKWSKKWARIALEKKGNTRVMTSEELRDLTKDIYSEAIIVGWENVVGRDGKEIPYNKENVKKLLTDLPDLFEEIAAVAQNAANYNKSAIEEITKN
jgi:hypothetical protein